MRSPRLFFATLAIGGAALVAACSGSDLSTDLATGTSSSGAASSSSGRPGGSSGSAPGFPGQPPPAPARDGGADRLDVTSMRSITVGKDVCGKPPGRCLDAQSFTVDFDAFTVTHTTCVELAAPDGGSSAGNTAQARSTKKIDLEDIAAVRAALDAVRVSEDGFDGFDGPIDTLEVVSTTGESALYSPFAGCGQDRFKKMTTGFDALWATVSSL